MLSYKTVGVDEKRMVGPFDGTVTYLHVATRKNVYVTINKMSTFV